MKIENGSLVVTVEGVEKTVPLATIAADAKVKAWIVPADYRADRLFVAVTIKGEAEEIPACDLAACEFLGELELDAGDDAKLEAVKAAKRLEINEACNTAVAALAASYPEREIQSWPQQVKEAEALAANPQASAPLLTAIADARGLPVVELASRVLGKMNAYAATSGTLIGRRQAAEDLIDVAASPEDVASIAW
jgi:hypothetical protein